jgi:hypothetical protein
VRWVARRSGLGQRGQLLTGCPEGRSRPVGPPAWCARPRQPVTCRGGWPAGLLRTSLTHSRQPASSRHLEQGVSVEILPRQPRVGKITRSHHGDDHVRISISVTNQSWRGGRTPPEGSPGSVSEPTTPGWTRSGCLTICSRWTPRSPRRTPRSWRPTRYSAFSPARPAGCASVRWSATSPCAHPRCSSRWCPRSMHSQEGGAGSASVPGTPARKSPFVGRHYATVMPDPWDRG